MILINDDSVGFLAAYFAVRTDDAGRITEIGYGQDGDDEHDIDFYPIDSPHGRELQSALQSSVKRGIAEGVFDDKNAFLVAAGLI